MQEFCPMNRKIVGFSSMVLVTPRKSGHAGYPTMAKNPRR